MKKYLTENSSLTALAVLNFLLIFLSSFNPDYGYFIDEFYYIACAKRPAWGYVDHPPFAPLLLSAAIQLFGSSVFVLRFIAAGATSLTVFFTGRLVAHLGGSKSSQVLAAVTLIFTPVSVAFGSFFSMNVFEPLFAILIILYILHMMQQNDKKSWIFIGALAGLGIMNKHTFVVTYGMIIMGLILSGQFKLFLNRQFIISLFVTLVIVLPNFIWQSANNFPSVEFYRNITQSKNVHTPPFDFILGQLMMFSPVSVLLAFTGVVFVFVKKEFRQYAFIGWFFVLVFGFMLLSGTSRSDRTLFAYPVAFAIGAMFIDRLVNNVLRKTMTGVLALALMGYFLLSLPLILPYFPYKFVAEHVQRLGINTEIEIGKKPPLPQILADRIGWEEKSQILFDEFNQLSPAERKQTIIATDNYGKAGALELFGEKYGIQEVFCGHNNYYLWGTGKAKAETVLMLDDVFAKEDFTSAFDSVTMSKKEFVNSFVSHHENHIVVFTCRKPRVPLVELFERGRVYH